MPHIDVLLTDEHARFLGKRAKVIHSTPGAVLQALISRVLQDAMAGSSHEGGPSVQAAFSGFAEQYSAVAESLGQTDPELHLGASSDPSAAEDAPSSAEAPAGDTPDPSDPVDLTREDLHQAFAEFERGYRDVSQQLFGEDAAFSAYLPDRHFYAVAVTIPREAESGSESITVAELLDSLPPSAEIESALSRYIAHLVVAADDPLDGPAIIYPRTRRGTRRHSADA